MMTGDVLSLGSVSTKVDAWMFPSVSSEKRTLKR
jgi:hypothetical protein